MMTSKLFYIGLIVFYSISLISQQTEDYTWANVPIGGGGYITGMKIHPLDSELRYYRTDVGGAYRWDAAQGKLVQLIFSTEKKHYAVAGIALHPTDLDVVYIAVGDNCNTSKTAIYKSNDRGETFTVVTGLPFYFAANGGRACDTSNDNNAPNLKDKDREGTPIEINPLNTNELYIGTREKGLYIMNVVNNNLTAVPSSKIPHNTEVYSIRTIKFHPNNPELVFIAYMGHGVYRGNTLTQTYVRLDANGNNNLDMALNDAMDLSISKNGNYLLVACKTSGILKATNLTASNVSWSSSPITNNVGLGYLTVECSPHNNNTAVTVAADWNEIANIETTIDGGSSWQTSNNRIDLNKHIFPWRVDAFGNNISQFAFDPQNVNRLHFCSWFSTFSSDDWSPTNGGTWHTQYSYGHEEIVPTDLIAFNTNQAGNFLMSGSGDHSGILFDDLTEFNYATETITDNFFNPGEIGKLKKSSSLDYCFSDPDHIAVCLTEEWSNSPGGIAVTSNGGQQWQLLADYTPSDGKSIVAMSSQNPDHLVFLTENGLKYTLNNGANIQTANGITSMPKNCFINNINCLGSTTINSGSINNSVFASYRNLTADKSLACVFYYYDWNGDFSISTDSGANWCIINNTDLPASDDAWQKARLTSIPNQAGHLWFNINNRLFYSTDGGVDWAEITNVDQVIALGSGVGETPGDYDALYFFGTIDNIPENHVYRSTDMGSTWTQITNHSEKELWGDIKIIAGDRNTFAKVYGTSSGQGVLHGQPANLNNCSPNQLLSKGTFDDVNSTTIPDWSFQNLGNASATASIDNQGNAFIDITTAGNFDYDIQLRQDNFGMNQGQFYLLKINAKADSPRSFNFKLRNKPNGSLTYLEETIDLGTNFQTYAYVFQAPVTDNDLRLVLLFGEDDPNISIDYISFLEPCFGSDITDIDCAQFLHIDDQIINSQLYAADQEIHSNATVTSNQVIFKAGDNISLEPGFSAENNAIFEAVIEVCN